MKIYYPVAFSVVAVSYVVTFVAINPIVHVDAQEEKGAALFDDHLDHPLYDDPHTPLFRALTSADLEDGVKDLEDEKEYEFGDAYEVDDEDEDSTEADSTDENWSLDDSSEEDSSEEDDDGEEIEYMESEYEGEEDQRVLEGGLEEEQEED